MSAILVGVEVDSVVEEGDEGKEGESGVGGLEVVLVEEAAC